MTLTVIKKCFHNQCHKKINKHCHFSKIKVGHRNELHGSMNTSEIPAQYILNTNNKHYKIHCNTLQTEINQQKYTSTINQLH